MPPAGTPPGKAAGIQVGEAVRSCLPGGEGRIRVSVYLMSDGKVKRAFVAPGPRIKGNIVKCVRERITGVMLPLSLKKADFVEWSLKLETSSVKVKVVRPPGLR